jgi:heme/copper-type cytochrome/quinol oxidase subunit 1
MKTMIVSIPLGLGLLALGLSIKAGTLSISADKLAILLSSITLVVGGFAGLIFAWQNRPLALRRNVRSRR